MKALLILALCSFIGVTQADSHPLKNMSSDQLTLHFKKMKEERELLDKIYFTVAPLNSPVKEAFARFKISPSDDTQIDQLKYKIRNSRDLFSTTKEERKRFEKKEFVDIGIVKLDNGYEFKIPVSKLPPGLYHLFVKVIDHKHKKEHDFKIIEKKNGNRYESAHIGFAIDQTMEVPMPDPKKNDATVAGIDTDNDGIRDDVQRAINETFANDIPQKLAMKQIAQAFQAGLVTVNDKEKSIQSSHMFLRGFSCIDSVADSDKAFKEWKNIKTIFLNTKERIEAEMMTNANYGGQRFPPVELENESNPCDFK